MRQAGLLALLAMAWTFVPGPVAAAAPPPTGSRVLIDGVRLVTLKNGMQLLLAPDSLSAAVDVAVWFRTGTSHESPGITGISHFFEHLMFRGSEHFGVEEHSRLVAAEGGQSNAYTDPDYACYYQTIPPGALDLVFRLEADRIASLRLTEESVAAEKRVVAEEKRWRAEFDPFSRALQDLDRLAWPGEAYGWPVLGRDEDVARITLDDCRKYFEDHYAPNNAVVTVVGGFDPAAALEAAKRWLEPLQHRTVGSPPAAAIAAQKSERRDSETMDIAVPVLLTAWKLPGLADPDAAAFELLGRILSTGPDARLRKALVTADGKCLGVEGTAIVHRTSGLLYAMATVRSLADTAEIERKLIGEVEDLATLPVSEQELDAARRQEEVATLSSWQTPHGRAAALGVGMMVADDYRQPATRFERLRELRPADLQRAAARVLSASHRDVLWIVPKNPSAVPGAPPEGPRGIEGGR